MKYMDNLPQETFMVVNIWNSLAAVAILLFSVALYPILRDIGKRQRYISGIRREIIHVLLLLKAHVNQQLEKQIGYVAADDEMQKNIDSLKELFVHIDRLVTREWFDIKQLLDTLSYFDENDAMDLDMGLRLNREIRSAIVVCPIKHTDQIRSALKFHFDGPQKEPGRVARFVFRIFRKKKRLRSDT